MAFGQPPTPARHGLPPPSLRSKSRFHEAGMRRFLSALLTCCPPSADPSDLSLYATSDNMLEARRLTRRRDNGLPRPRAEQPYMAVCTAPRREAPPPVRQSCPPHPGVEINQADQASNAKVIRSEPAAARELVPPLVSGGDSKGGRRGRALQRQRGGAGLSCPGLWARGCGRAATWARHVTG